MGGIIVEVWMIAATIISVTLAIALTIAIVKGIKYLKRAEERERGRNYREAKRTIDDIEQELKNKK